MNLLTKNSLGIVHVEDDDHYADLAECFLNMAGFTRPVVRFASGRAAIDYLSKVEPACAPHVILLDLEMPGMNGLEVLHWLRANYFDANLPVCILTSSFHPEDRQQAELAGATNYFFKTALYRTVTDYLDKIVDLHNQRCLQAMAKLTGAMSELALLSEFTADPVVLTDPEGGIIWVNESFGKMCGYTLEEIRGRKPGPILQGRDSDPDKVKALHLAVHGVTPCECEIINYRKNGAAYPVHISLSPILSHGTLDGFLAVEQELLEI